MRDRIEAVALRALELRVAARAPLPVAPKALALAAAIRVFDRYPILARLTLTVDGSEIDVSREEVERLLAPHGFIPLRERGRWRQMLAELARAYPGEGAE